jgi:hypothetical protein
VVSVNPAERPVVEGSSGEAVERLKGGTPPSEAASPDDPDSGEKKNI